MKEISNVISREMKDPRLLSMVSVLNAQMSADFRHINVDVSIYSQNEINNLKTLEALQHAAGFISSIVSKNLRLRYAPNISFNRSHSIENSIELAFKLKELSDESEIRHDKN